MYSLKIGLGGTGSNTAEPIKPHSAVSNGVHHPSSTAVIATLPPSAAIPSLASPSSSSATSTSTSSLLSRLASPSAHSPFSASFNAALSHVIPVSISARPVPLTYAENAAEVKRQERKQKKAERRKAEKENSQPPSSQQQPEPNGTAGSDTAAGASAASEHLHTNGYTNASNATTDNHTSTQQQQVGTTSKPRKQRKAADTKRALHDEQQLTLTVAQLKAIVAEANEKVIRECCKQMTHLSVKQRKDMHDTLTQQHTSTQSTSLYQSLYNSSVVQSALVRCKESEQLETIEVIGGEGEGDRAVEVDVLV